VDTEQKLQNKASIVFFKGPLTGSTFQIDKSIISIGRHSSNDIVVPDQKVSRHHARLVRNEKSWSIEKLSQTSPITVDQQSIEKAVIQHHSKIGLGEDSSFVFLLAIDDEQLEVTKIALRPSPAISLIPPSLAERGIETVSMAPVDQLMPEQNLDADPASSPVQPPASLPLPNQTEIAAFSALGIPTLEVTDNTTGAGRTYPLARQIINIGQGSTNDIVINDPIISDLHLQIVRQDNEWVLIHPHPDAQRTLNGLLYHGRKIKGDKSFRKTLTRGDVFRIEDEHGTLVTLAYNDGSGAPQITLSLLQPIRLQTASITIGRMPDNDVILNHPQVSAHHAQLTSENNTYRLIDLNSTNHTYVNGIAVTSLLLKPDDEIRIGPFKLIYTGDELKQYDESENIRIDALDLRKVGNKQAVLLNNISLSIPPRSFIALVGSSGTGKSTLMDALNGLRPAQNGSVFYNGQDYYQHLAAFRSLLGYVPQDDIIHRDLTVERALYYAAKLRLPTDFTHAQIEQRIDEVLEDVEMTHRRSMLIKKLSGGQRKRISIALELLANPSVFFLDEPTSGLDPGLDRKMMILLRKLADKGHTIVLVTHATNNINVCDAICFLAHGGRVVYYGPAEEAKTYFQQPDFAEIYNLLEPTDEIPTIPAEAEERFKQSSQYQKYIAEPLSQRPIQTTQQLKNGAQAPKRGNPWKQFIELTLRYLELLWNDKLNLVILLLQAPAIGLILFILIHSLNETTIFQPPISLNNQGDAQRFLFVLSFAAIMFGCINATREIVKEIHIYQRERAVNLGILPYLFSKILVLSMLCLVQCAILIVISNLAAPFHAGIFLPEFWEVYITLVLTSVAGVMVGLVISALVRNNDQAISFIPLVLLPQLVFSGSMFALKDIPIQIFGAIFSLRWSMIALGSSLDLIGNGDKLFGTCDSCNSYQHNLHYLLFTWAALFTTILILGVLTGYFLKRRDKHA
jgi:ABC transport system ATP-binding/permease protein